MRYLIDTNIIIYYFNGITDDESLHELLAESFNISIITKIEFLGWNAFAANTTLYQQATTFIQQANIFPLTEAITEQTIQLRQQFKTKTPDAIIAATALVNKFTVITCNTDDFTRLGIETLSIKTKI